MATKSTVFKQSIKQKKGHWNFKDLYDMAHQWLLDNGYLVAENKYEDKVTGGGKDLAIEWTAEKKVTDYFKYRIDLRWTISSLKDVEAEREGKKVSTNTGDVKIEVKGILVMDYEEKWENKPLWKFMRGIYDRYIIRTTIDEYEDSLYEESSELIDQLKAFLQM